MFHGWRIRRRLVFSFVGMTFVIVMLVAFSALSGSRGLMRNQIATALLENNQKLANALDGELRAVAALARTLRPAADLPLAEFGALGRAALAAGDGLIARVNLYQPFGRGAAVTVIEGETGALLRLINAPGIDRVWITTARRSPGLTWHDSRAAVATAIATEDGLLWVDLDGDALAARLADLLSGSPTTANSYGLLVTPEGGVITSYPLTGPETGAMAPSIDEMEAILTALEPGANFVYSPHPFGRWDAPIIIRSPLDTTGWALVSILPRTLLNNPVDQNVIQVLLLVISGMLLVLLVARQVARRWLSEPLGQLTRAAQEIGSGDMRYLISYTDRGDEIGDLARALDTMKINLNHSYEELARWGRTLEKRVRERTMELDMARQQAQMHAAELQAVYDASLSVVSDYQLTAILQTLTERISSLLPAGYCAVWLITSDQRHMQLIASTPIDRDRLNTLIPIDQGLAGLTVREMNSIILEDYARWPGRPSTHNPLIEQALGVPLTFYNEPIGAIIAGREAGDSIFTADDRRLVSLLANLISPVIRNAQLYVRLGEAVAEAKRANDVKTHFLAGVTHELRSPLNLIINNSDFMRIGEFGPVTADQKSRLDQTIRSAEHLLYLINDLLDISKIEAGQMQLFIEPADIYPVLEDALDAAMALIDEGAAVALGADIAEGLPLIPIDARRVRQVVINLLSNAIKFTPEGTVRLRVSLEPPFLKITVEDTGIGIPEGERERLFGMFERSERARQLGIEGSGLGLPISRYLVEAHGGSLTLTSRPGRGTTFTCLLPLAGPATDPRGKRVTAILPRPQL